MQVRATDIGAPKHFELHSKKTPGPDTPLPPKKAG